MRKYPRECLGEGVGHVEKERKRKTKKHIYKASEQRCILTADLLGAKRSSERHTLVDGNYQNAP